MVSAGVFSMVAVVVSTWFTLSFFPMVVFER